MAKTPVTTSEGFSYEIDMLTGIIQAVFKSIIEESLKGFAKRLYEKYSKTNSEGDQQEIPKVFTKVILK